MVRLPVPIPLGWERDPEDRGMPAHFPVHDPDAIPFEN
jgi:hypothetical protein